jgi:inhibitor of cysteine peptidase
MKQRQLRIFTAALSITALLLTAGCGSSRAITRNQSADGTTVELAPDQTLVLTLASNPSTGYSWAVAAIDESILQQQGDPTYTASPARDPQVVGAGGTETFRFRALASGQTTLQLIYRRPWEQDVPPIETFTLTATVR